MNLETGIKISMQDVQSAVDSQIKTQLNNAQPIKQKHYLVIY